LVLTVKDEQGRTEDHLMVKNTLRRQKNYRLTVKKFSKDDVKNGNVEEGRGSADDGCNGQSTVKISGTSKEDQR